MMLLVVTGATQKGDQAVAFAVFLLLISAVVMAWL